MASSIEIQKKRIRFFLDCLGHNIALKVLDIGSQDGTVCNHLLRRGHKPYGIEIVEQLVKASSQKYPSIDFICADGEKRLPFDDNFFDVVWAGDIIEHIRHTDVFVNEMNRILRLGGRFILSTPMHNRLKNVIISLFNFEKHFNPEFPHLRFYTLKSLGLVLTSRGFKIQSVRYIGRVSPLANSMFVVCKKIAKKNVLNLHRF